MIAPLRLGPRGDLAMLALRLVMGVAFVIHGWPKIQHPATWLGSTLPWAPTWLAAVVAFVEFGGGIALVAGFATSIFAFLLACEMIVVIFAVLVPHRATFVASHGHHASFEEELLYFVVATTLVLIGPGAYSLDGARGATGAPGRGRKRR